MFTSPHPDVEIPDLSVYDTLFGGIASSDLDRIALRDGTSGAETSYRQLISQINALAGALAAAGIGIGDVVALHAPNVPAFATVFHGILRAGATATTVNGLYNAEEIEAQLLDAGATMVFTVSALLPQAWAAASACDIPSDRVVVLDGAEGHASLTDLLVRRLPAPDVSFDPATHVAVLPYSSGTTGRPKGVMLSHRNLVANVQQSIPQLGMRPDDRILAVLPFFHIYGMTVLLNLALACRASLVTMPRFDLAEFLRIIQDFRCSYVFIAPPIAVALAKHPLVDEFDLSSVHTIFSGAAPLDATLGRAVEERLDCRLRQGYGMTELSPVSHAIAFQAEGASLDSVGTSLPNMRCRIVDPETGVEVEYPAAGSDEESAPGELLCAGPNVMLGYLGNEEATRATLEDDGFLHTGDIATVRGDGTVRIIERLKELIKYHGYQVAPAELEALLLGHPAIADAAVIGVSDEDGQEVPKAFIVLQAGQDVTSEALMAWVAERVAPHKKIRRVEVVEVIPKSTSGKILRKDLRAAEALRQAQGPVAAQ
ncbi:AMP-binding protein [Plantibacter sp. Leaf314]|uniref:AMP-binding protein n=1 Tax=Plantibacter sp. Leaf314 TaxID=1736333 RepID=UPI000B0E3E34|nr:AMP-binding protein [Plantibacter sp. Leaf314]